VHVPQGIALCVNYFTHDHSGWQNAEKQAVELLSRRERNPLQGILLRCSAARNEARFLERNLVFAGRHTVDPEMAFRIGEPRWHVWVAAPERELHAPV
jgi:hypothetical protein